MPTFFYLVKFMCSYLQKNFYEAKLSYSFLSL